jgi:hypothetical protein
MAADAVARAPPRGVIRPRGLVFHLPPQNVETVFLYSWIVSYLVGNANVTRLPTSLGADMQALLTMFQDALTEVGDRSQWFVRYDVSGDVNRAVSAASDARLVWGGDAKIQSLAPLPLRNGGKPLWFGDRRSLALIDGTALAALGEAELAAIAGRLHNDIFVFDQMACSSPQRIFVIGDEVAHGPALDRLMAALSSEALARGSAPPSGHVIQKMVMSMARAARGQSRRVVRHSNALTTVSASPGAEAAPVGGGFLEIVFLPDATRVYAWLSESSQTAVHFGFSEAEIARFAAGLPPRRLTRIVPLGQALDFDSIWDGYDLVFELTQCLRVL